MKVHRLCIVAPNNLEIPDGTTHGTRLTITAEVTVARVYTELIDITGFGSESDRPDVLPGPTVAGCVATAWSAT